jgi:23S rRNA (pseudouridine1915-N3)-methyltransferase
MRILAIGKMKSGPMAALADHYARHLPWPLAIEEYEERRQLPDLKRQEAALLRAALVRRPPRTLIALDEKGESLTSRGFAALIDTGLQQGEITFLIGGADGLEESLCAEARLRLAFGAMTWPHQLARIMLLEQIYRAGRILAGHPYHRD